MVDATIIHAPPSTKNQERKRDPEMHQTKKGNQWYFDMKVHTTTNRFCYSAHFPARFNFSLSPGSGKPAA